MFNRIFSPQTMEIQILNSIPYTSFSCFSDSDDNKIENFLDKDNPKTYSYVPQEITDSIKFDGYEEDLYLKINPLPIIKDEDKSFFYKCACLYKTEEYKNKTNITNFIVEFLYHSQYSILFVLMILIHLKVFYFY